jgi:hypothetical protein
MRYFAIVSTVLTLLSGATAAQTPSTPVSPALPPQQTTPEVIVPPGKVDPGFVVAPKVPAAADPNIVIPGQGGIGLSETDARQLLEQGSYKAISDLVRRPDGAWAGSAQKGGVPVKFVIDRMGKLSSD